MSSSDNALYVRSFVSLAKRKRDFSSVINSKNGNVRMLWEEAFFRRSLVRNPIRDTESEGLLMADKESSDVFILLDNGQRIDVCHVPNCHGIADHIGKHHRSCSENPSHSSDSGVGFNKYLLAAGWLLEEYPNILTVEASEQIWEKLISAILEGKDKLTMKLPVGQEVVIMEHEGQISYKYYNVKTWTSDMKSSLLKSSFICGSEFCLNHLKGKGCSVCMQSSVKEGNLKQAI